MQHFIRGGRRFILLILRGIFLLMLHAFSLAPFEPLETAALEAFTYNTFVLFALALAARRGVLCALRHGRFVTLSSVVYS